MVSFVPRFTQTSGKFRSGPRPATKIFMTSFLTTAILRSAGASAERRARIGKDITGAPFFAKVSEQFDSLVRING